MLIAVRDTQLWVESFGDGPPLLFVHGFPLCSDMWRATVERLAGRFRCILPDLRGFGRSPLFSTDGATRADQVSAIDRAQGTAAHAVAATAVGAAAPIATRSIGIDTYADDLAALLDAIGEKRPVVPIGLSMGGIIVFEFFRRHRDRVRGLGLVCTRANPESPEGVARREAVAASVLAGGSRVLADQMIGTVLAPSASPNLRQTVHAMMAAQPPAAVAAASRALAGRADSFPTLPRIDCPTLVVAADQDTITPAAGLREMHEKIPASQFAIIPGAGHLPPMEQTELFGKALEQFLSYLNPV